MTEWVSDLQKLIRQGRTFATLMADPPWPYGDQATRGSTTKQGYPTMPIDELQAIPVGDLAAKDAHLYLWTTVSFREEAMQLVKDWGFTHKSEVVWLKPTKDRTAFRLGSGNYFRLCHEIMLFGVRGKKATHLRCHDLPSVIQCPRGEPSRKPDVFRRMVEQASYGPYLELFGRELVEGWTVFGNQNLTFIPGTTSQPRCAVCGEPFPAKRRSGKYCGDTCRQRAHRQRHDNARIIA